jgi:hypothetical protein
MPLALSPVSIQPTRKPASCYVGNKTVERVAQACSSFSTMTDALMPFH